MKIRATWTLGFGMLLAAGMALGQAVSPAFEVASIKPAPPLSVDAIRSGQLRLGINVRGSRADFGFVSLADLLAYAYRVKPYQVAGPDWMRETRWEILAKLPDGESSERAPEMMQALLVERFKLSVHREDREHPVYEMVAAKGEVKLKASDPEVDTPGPDAAGTDAAVPGFFLGGGIGAGASNVRVNADGKGMVVTGGPNGTMRITPGSTGGMRLEMSKVTMPALADMLTPFTDRTVVDKTDLKGTYQVTLDLPMEALMGLVQNAARTVGLPAGLPAGAGARLGGPGGLIPGGVGPLAGASDPSGSSIVQAIQQLGLKLEARKAPVETIVVDRLEKTPTEN